MDVLRAALRRLPPVRRVERFVRDPAGVQRRALVALLRRAEATEFGRRHFFSEIARDPNPERAWREAVPLGRPESFAPDVARMLAGEPDVLWPGRVTTFVRSTGTTGTPKLLPCTDGTLRQWVSFSASVVLGHVADTGDLGCLRGRTVSMAGIARPDPSRPGVVVGDISALASDWWAERSPLRHVVPRRDLPRGIRELPTLDEQVDAACDHSMDEDVRIVSLAPSWALLFFERLLERHGARHGSRARTVGDVWPNLRLVIGGGVPMATYREALERRIGLPRVAILDTYGSSESLVAFQRRAADEGMLLDLGLGTYFELVRAEELDSAAPRRFAVADVEAGPLYAPVVTTPSGLWACPLGDLVRFVRTAPHELVVEGRTTEIVDSWGEKLAASQAQRAIEEACARSGTPLVAFHVVPRPASEGTRHAHAWLVEVERAPADRGAFARVLDERLRALSPTYAQCRDEMGLGAPSLRFLRPGALRRALERVRAGTGVQGKVPRTSDRTLVADAVASSDEIT